VSAASPTSRSPAASPGEQDQDVVPDAEAREVLEGATGLDQPGADPEGVQGGEEARLQLGCEDAAGTGEVQHHEQEDERSRRPAPQEGMQADTDQHDCAGVHPGEHPDGSDEWGSAP
jgi:hypothetical protein